MSQFSSVQSKQEITYAGFISYNREADGKLARALQSALHRFARPWNQLRAIRIFLDDANLAVNPNLWSSVKEALDGSEFFILLASPESAASVWVEKELSYWIENKPIENVLVALAGGEAWDVAVPPSLRGRFVEEPRYTDLRWVREEFLSSSNDRFRDDDRFRYNVADLAAPLHHRDKDELFGEDRQ